MGNATKDSSSINVLLVDDQALLRQSLAGLLENQAGLNVIGGASDGHEAIKQTALLRPDVVLLDIEMPNLDGLSATRLITQRFPHTKVIVLSAHDNEVYLRNALEAGAKAYLLKNTLFEELSKTVRLVCEGYCQSSRDSFEKTANEFNYEHTSVSVLHAPSEIKASSLNGKEQQELYTLEDILEVANLSSTLLDRFEPDELQDLMEYFLTFPKIASALQVDLSQRLTSTPKNPALLYLHGTLAHHVWSLPEIAFRSLRTGFQLGVENALPFEALLLFYQQAALINPVTAFQWLTEMTNLWGGSQHLPFLLQEGVRLFGERSDQVRSIILLRRIRILKKILTDELDKVPTLPQTKT